MKKIITVSCMVAGIILLSSCSNTKDNTTNSNNCLTLQKENTTLQKENTTLQKENTTLQKENTTLQKENTTLQKENTTLQKENTTLQKENTTLQKENTKNESIEAAIKKVFLKKNKTLLPEKFSVYVTRKWNNHTRGMISFIPTKEEKEAGFEGAGGIFLAKKINNNWNIVREGNGGISCQEIKGYDFPDWMINDCY